jgi:hypothetical protein
MAVNLGFLDLSRYFLPREAEWTTFQTHYFSENLVTRGSEPGTSGSVARTLTNRPQRRFTSEVYLAKIY